jgi:glycosyltransferase involved in cell wall biosynthesis
LRSSSLNILFLSQVLPYPLDAGPKVRSYYTLRYLSQHHRVTLVSFTRPTDSLSAVAHLQTICHAVHTLPMQRSRWLDLMYLGKSLITGTPFLIERDWVPAMTELLTRVLESNGGFDAIHADQLWMAPYALWVRGQSSLPPAPLLVLDQHNAVYRIPQRMQEDAPQRLQRWLLGLEWRKLSRYEVDTCRQFDRVTWVTEEDYAAVQGQALRREACVSNSAVIPICTDPENVPVVERTAQARRVTFVGGLHYPPNAQGVLWFAQEIFPQILQAVPDAVLTVIGKQPPAQLSTLGIPSANLDVTGYVADLNSLLSETAVSVVPLLAGGGMRVKILEAWSWGIPVVSTSVGAEGMVVRAGEDIVIADTPTAFAQATIQLLQNPARAQQIGQAGRQMVMEKYNWHEQYQDWCMVYRPDNARESNS